MATGMESYEEAVRPFKDNLLQNVRTKGYQKVLEIGIGAAPNLQYLVQDGSSVSLFVHNLQNCIVIFEKENIVDYFKDFI